MDRSVTDPDALTTAVERIGFLEWRLEQVAGQLEAERDALTAQRQLVAAGARREADAADRARLLEHRLAEARAEAARLGDRAAQAEKTRREVEQRLQSDETGARIADQYASLLATKRKDDVTQGALDLAQRRIDRLERQLERFFERLIRWQHSSAAGDDDAIDLAELIAELRNEMLRLGAENAAASESNQALRRTLADAGIEPPRAVAPALPPTTTPQWLKAPVESSKPTAAVDAHDARLTIDSMTDELRRAHAATCFEAVLSATPERAVAAVDALLGAAGEAAEPALIAALDAASSFELRAACLHGLGVTAGSLARRTLDRAARDDDWRIRAASIEALLGHAVQTSEDAAESSASLNRALDDADPRVRRRAVVAASGVTGLDPTPILLDRIHDADAATRRTIATAIGERGDDKALLMLTRLLLDEDATVRVGVARVLGRRLFVDLSAIANASERTRRATAANLRARLSAQQTFETATTTTTRSATWST